MSPVKYTILMVSSLFTLQAHATSSTTQDYTDFGPLLTLTQSPIQAMGLSLKTRDAFGWDKGTLEVYGQGTVSSVWADGADYIADYYQNDVNVGFIYAPADDWKVDVNYLYRFAGNNKLDGLVNGFHDALGLDDNGRHDVDNDRFYIQNKKTGSTLEDFQGDTLNNALNLYVEKTVFSTKRQALSLGGALYYNKVFNGDFAQSSFEQAIQLNYSFYLTDANRFYTSVNFVHHDTDGIDLFSLREFTTNGSISYQYLFNERHSILAEFRMQQGATHNDENELSMVSFEPIVGYRYNLGFAAVEFSFTENVINSDNSADFSLTLGYRQRF